MHHVAVVTGTRAEYGLLRPVLRKLQAHPDIRVSLLVTGAHLSEAHGNTINEVEADGIPIELRLDILSRPVPGGRAGTARRTAMALDGFLAHFEQAEEKPDAVLLLGDRYEAFAAGQAAALLDIPLVHISGGDVTHGADDDWFRHCLTKMAKLHFPSCEAYRKRLLRMGEEPWRVFNTGGLGDENIRSMQLLSRRTLGAGLAVDVERPYALITLHPETQSDMPPAAQARALLEALEAFPDLGLLFTGANADAGGAEMNREIALFCKSRPNAELTQSLGVLRYLSAMKNAAVVIGNSSSGVVETPSFGVAAVDIGERQAGRVTAENVVHCNMYAGAIREAIALALEPQFALAAKTVQSPYNGGDTSGKIVATLAEFLENGRLRQPKIFYDGEGDAPCGF